MSAAPPLEINSHNFNGTFDLNKKRSDAVNPLLKMQGVPWIVRQAASYASVYVSLEMYTDETGVVHLDLQQITTANKMTEERIMDGAWRQKEIEFWGEVKAYCKFVKISDLEDEYMKQGWLEEGEGDERGDLVFSHAESIGRGWVAEQVWGFAIVDGQRTLVRKIVAKKGKEEHKIRMIYEYRSV